MADADQPQPKRARVDPDTVVQAQDQVAAALVRIAPFTTNPKKVVKALSLLRQLLVDNKLQPHHGPLCFEALRLSMLNTSHSNDPLLRKEYSKTFTAFSKFPQLFTADQRNHLDTLGVWAVFRNLLHTDDSFMFTKVVKQLTMQIQELQPAGVGEEEVLQGVLHGQMGVEDSPVLRAAAVCLAAGDAEGGGAGGGGGGEQSGGGTEEKGRNAAAAEEKGRNAPAAEEGGDAPATGAITAATQQQELSDTPAPSVVWDEAQAQVARRQALLDCMLAAKEQYGQAWARTTVDLLVDTISSQCTNRFTPSQQQTLMQLKAFVHQQRIVRKSGRGAAVPDERTAFEKATAAWGKADVSARGNVGGGGDHKSAAWLG